MTDEPAAEPEPPGERGERIAKWLARAGIASRRDAETMLGAGRIKLNNAAVTHPATFVAPGDIVRVDGRVVDPPGRTRLWRYHKPDGLMTTHRDPEGRPTVFERLPPGLPRVVSVGRLDLNSEGLLLLTNDGGLARRLELPATGWLRRYRVRVHGAVAPADLAALAKGVTVAGIKYGPIEAGLELAQGGKRLGQRRPARGPQPRGAAGDGASRLAGVAAHPHRLRPVPARPAAARRDRGGARPRAARPAAARGCFAECASSPVSGAAGR